MKKNREDVLKMILGYDEKKWHRIFADFMNFTNVNACLADYETGEVLFDNEFFRSCYKDKISAISTKERYSIYDIKELFIPTDVRAKLDQEKWLVDVTYRWEDYVEEVDCWFDTYCKPVDWIEGEKIILIASADITQQKVEATRLHRLAYTDERLQIPNSLQLLKDIEKETEDYLICFNIQSLSNINYLYGREAGDSLIQTVICWIKKLLQEQGSIYRIDSSDFAILIRNEEEQRTMELAESIHERFNRPWEMKVDGTRQKIYTDLHMGIVHLRESWSDSEKLQNDVEKLLNNARRDKCIAIFNEQKSKELNELLQLRMDLKASILNGMKGFSLHFQPIVDAECEQWVGVEALCRWERPGVGNVRPDIFIAEAENMGLINVVTEWVIKTAILQVKSWELEKEPNFILDVNMSPLQLRDGDFVRLIQDLLNQYDYPAEKLSVEVTENAEICFDEKNIQQLKDIRAIGVQLSLDDFGTGYANLSAIKNLPINVLKIDRSLITGIENDKYLQYMSRAIIEFAHVVGMRVIAEGIEKKEHCELLRRYGVNMIQGFYYSKPLSTNQMKVEMGRFKQRASR